MIKQTGLTLSGTSSNFVNNLFDYTVNWTPVSSITIINWPWSLLGNTNFHYRNTDVICININFLMLPMHKYHGGLSLAEINLGLAFI